MSDAINLPIVPSSLAAWCEPDNPDEWETLCAVVRAKGSADGRRPLADGWILGLWPDSGMPKEVIEFARKVESSHGIVGEPRTDLHKPPLPPPSIDCVVEFGRWYGLPVDEHMDLQTQIAWDHWQRAWNAGSADAAERSAKLCAEWARIAESGKRHGVKCGAQECARLIRENIK